MAYNICSICGKFFNQNGNDKCPKCHDKYNKEYDIVREYISKHIGATAMEVNAVTGVSITSILKFIKEGTINYANQK